MKTKYTLGSILVLALLLLSLNGLHAAKWVVQVSNYAFTPSSLSNVMVGDTIRWQWVSGSHTTTSSTIPGGAAAWDELIIPSNQVYEYKVTVAGTYNYVCTPHVAMGMVGSFVASGSAPTLTVSPSNQNVGASAGSTSFTVTSNSNWTVTSNAGWCTVTSSGSGNGTITASYQQNSTVSQRIANITVSVSGLPNQVVTVTQAGAAPTLSVMPPDQSVSSSAGSAAFTVTSNTSWTASSNASWCNVTSSGNGNGSIMADYTENISTDERIATITVNVSGLTPVTVTVTQDGSSVAVAEANGGQFRIYPNPSSGLFNLIQTGSSDKIQGYKVFDPTGKTITDKRTGGENPVQIDLQDQPGGFYYLEIRTGQSQSIRKLIIRK